MKILAAAWLFLGAAFAGVPGNLAPQARIAADSEHSAPYQARFVADGHIPAPGSRADPGKAWCVRGQTHRTGATLALEWPAPVTVAEVIYFGRTAWFAEECWKDYELRLDGDGKPAVRGRLQMGHGPQRIRLPAPVRASRLELRFTSSYGGLNPGASEIQVFSVPPAAEALPAFVRMERGPAKEPVVETEQVPFSPGLAASLRSGGLGFRQMLLIKRRELNPSHVYTYHVEGFQAGGALCLHDLLTGGIRELVASPEGQILDCDLSFDGREILFSWRRKREAGYHLFTVQVDGSHLRQITEGAWHDYNACWLPDGGIAFLSTRESRFAYCWVSPVGVLHRMEADGSRVARLSANIVNDFTPGVLPDGRLIYSRWEYVDKPAIPIQSLWTIRPDGTGLAGYYGNRVLSPATFMEARPVPGSGKVLCVLTSHNGPCRGALGLIDRSRGDNAQESIENITPWLRIGPVDKGSGNDVRGPYENPFPLDGELFLVSRRGTAMVRDYAGRRMAEILAPGKDGLGFYSPQPLRPRPRPPVIRSAPAKPAPPDHWATVFLQDVYQGLEPHVKRGEIKEICVVEEMKKEVRTDVKNRAFGFQFPVISCGATYAAKTVWGSAPVAPDGSACFLVPAGVPVYFLALDGQGRARQRMRTFTHFMPGETQSCVGCHESRLHAAPPRAQPAAREPAPLRPPPWGRSGFAYATVVQPVLDRHCVACHRSPLPAGRVDLSGDKTDYFSASYEALARGRHRHGSEGEYGNPYTNWIPTYNGMEANILEITPQAWGSPRSRLADLVLEGHRDAAGHARVNLSAEERRRLFTWIDLNVPYYGTAETTHVDAKGCRRVYPEALDAVLAEVASRRCASCHAQGIPREVWTRIEHPEWNGFLLAPLPVPAGGSGACGAAVFADRADPDYQAILEAFEPVKRALRERPRMDMPGAVPDATVDRSRLGQL